MTGENSDVNRAGVNDDSIKSTFARVAPWECGGGGMKFGLERERSGAGERRRVRDNPPLRPCSWANKAGGMAIWSLKTNGGVENDDVRSRT